MRKIIFRGKRKGDGEWVIGYFVSYKDEAYIFEQEQVNYGLDLGGYLDCCKMVEVDPKSVGQHTGLTDRSGKDIFEGDILRIGRKTHGCDEREVVFYDYGGFSPFAIHDWECTPDADDVEVIGNIHENPELVV